MTKVRYRRPILFVLCACHIKRYFVGYTVSLRDFQREKAFPIVMRERLFYMKTIKNQCFPLEKPSIHRMLAK